MKNPFLLKGYISDEYFCDRKKETADLMRYITNLIIVCKDFSQLQVAVVTNGIPH